jgi:hypothetical protein
VSWGNTDVPSFGGGGNGGGGTGQPPLNNAFAAMGGNVSFDSPSR